MWRLIFRLEVVNREIFKNCPSKNIIFYANHASYFDAFLVSTNIPLSFYFKFKGFRFLAKRKHAHDRWYAPFIRAMGAYPLPENKKGYMKVMPDTIKHTRAGYTVVIFPIPHLQQNIDPNDARPGIAYLIEQTQATLIPTYIDNSFAWKVREIFINRRKIKVVYGKPITCSEYSILDDNYKIKSKQLMEKIIDLKNNDKKI
jgi:1-acyl-sn-glycerol-3-phosphate acyltransferase